MALITEVPLEQQALDQVILFQAADGQVSLDVRLEADTVWLSQAQMAELFGRERSVISKHIGNVFKEGELVPESTCAKFAQVQTEGTRVIQRQVDVYNLDVIISVGYRVKSPRGTQVRIWATQVLRQHLNEGYSLHQRRLHERGLVSDEGQAVLEVVQRYSRAWRWLLAYDEDRLAPAFAEPDGVPEALGLAEAQRAIDTLRRDLAHCGEATPLFGQENRQALAGILGAIEQTFDGQPRIADNGMAALALLIAESAPQQKDLVIRLVMALLEDQDSPSPQPNPSLSACSFPPAFRKDCASWRRATGAASVSWFPAPSWLSFSSGLKHNAPVSTCCWVLRRMAVANLLTSVRPMTLSG